MPWDGDTYAYAPSALLRCLGRLPEIRELVYARGNPDTELAALLYDLLRALEGMRLTRRQKQALILFVNGYDTLTISVELGVSEWTVKNALRAVRRKAVDYLNKSVIYQPLVESSASSICKRASSV